MEVGECPHFRCWEKGRRVIKRDEKGQTLEKQNNQGGFTSTNARRNKFTEEVANSDKRV